LIKTYLKYCFCILFFGLSIFPNQELKGQSIAKNELVEAINSVRTSGCKCGRKYYPPIDEIQWNDTLYLSSLHYAKYMHENNFFSHVGPNQKNIGDRVQDFNYDWQFIGENLGQGQSDIAQLVVDWKNSFTHCKLMMDNRFTEMGLAEYKGYWVLHLGKPFNKKEQKLSQNKN
jgi:uncharacterized protein YkwD